MSLSALLFLGGLVGASCAAPAAETAPGADPAPDAWTPCPENGSPNGRRDELGYIGCANLCERAAIYCHGIGGPWPGHDPVVCARKRAACCSNCAQSYP